MPHPFSLTPCPASLGQKLPDFWGCFGVKKEFLGKMTLKMSENTICENGFQGCNFNIKFSALVIMPDFFMLYC